MHTNHGADRARAVRRGGSQDRRQLPEAVARRLLRRADLPPRDQGLHDPGRLPGGHRHRRPGLQVRGRVQPAQDRARRARDGQRAARTRTAASSSSSPPTAAPWLDGKHTVFGRVIVRHGRRGRDRGPRDRPGRPARSRTPRSSAWRSMTVELLWWDGCPSHPQALAQLRACSAKRVSTPTSTSSRSASDEQARRERFPGSPTIRIDGRDIVDPERNEPFSLTCRVLPDCATGSVSPVPDPEDVREAVRARQVIAIGDHGTRLRAARHGRTSSRRPRRRRWSSSPATTARTRSPGTTG